MFFAEVEDKRQMTLVIDARVKEGWCWEVLQFTALRVDAFSNRKVVFSLTRGKQNQSFPYHIVAAIIQDLKDIINQGFPEIL